MSNQAQAPARPPELLAPAGGQEQLEAALRFGADAVYVGGQRFGLRAFAGNFDHSALERAVRTAHGLGRRLYGALEELLGLQGVRTAYGCVTLPNGASEGLHAAMGFHLAGTWHSVGYKCGAWHDVAWFEKEIAPHGREPAPLRPIGAIPPERAAEILRRYGAQ